MKFCQNLLYMGYYIFHSIGPSSLLISLFVVNGEGQSSCNLFNSQKGNVLLNKPISELD